jgi:hypothetical protein
MVINPVTLPPTRAGLPISTCDIDIEKELRLPRSWRGGDGEMTARLGSRVPTRVDGGVGHSVATATNCFFSEGNAG